MKFIETVLIKITCNSVVNFVVVVVVVVLFVLVVVVVACCCLLLLVVVVVVAGWLFMEVIRVIRVDVLL